MVWIETYRGAICQCACIQWIHITCLKYDDEKHGNRQNKLGHKLESHRVMVRVMLEITWKISSLIRGWTRMKDIIEIIKHQKYGRIAPY